MFSPSYTSSDGLVNVCKECKNKQVREATVFNRLAKAKAYANYKNLKDKVEL
jgi:hypothetical protein